MQRIKNFLRDESGAESIEYAIVAGLLAVAAAAAYGTGLVTELTNKVAGLL